MQPHQLIHYINKLLLTLNFRFQFFIYKLDKSLCTSLIIRIKSILMIDMHKHEIGYYIANGGDLIDRQEN